MEYSPYKIQTVQKLKDSDKEFRIEQAQDEISITEDCPDISDNVFLMKHILILTGKFISTISDIGAHKKMCSAAKV